MVKRKMILVLCLIAGAVLLLAMTNRPAKNTAGETRQAPAKSVFYQFNLLGLDGKEKHNLGALIAGKPAVVNIWATWCPPCRAEIPDLVEVYNKYKQKNVIIVGVSVDQGDIASVKSFVNDYGITYPILLDDGTVSREFGVRGIPTTLFVNAEGKVVAKRVGYADKAYFSSQIDKLLQK